MGYRVLINKSLRRLERQISGINPNSQHWPRLRGEQVNAYKKLVPYGLVASAANAIFLTFLFAFTNHSFYLWIWVATVSVISFLGARSGFANRKRRYKVRHLPKHVMMRPVRESFALGLAWGMAPVLLLGTADGWQSAVLLIVCAGMMAGGAYMLSSIPRASMIFVSMISLGVTGGLINRGLGIEEFAVLCLLASYTLVMVISAYWNYGNYLRSWLQQIKLEAQAAELERQKGLVSVLLKDFEESTSDFLWEMDDSGFFFNVSDGLRELTGLGAERVTLSSIQTLFDQEANTDIADARYVTRRIRHQLGFTDVLLPVFAGGTRRWWKVTGKPVFGPKGFEGYRGVVSDVTDAHEADARISYLAHYDALTDLPNRQSFNQAIESCFYAQSVANEAFAVVSADLDFFKTVNDVHGHDVGDAVLKEAAAIMRKVVGQHDAIARMGGDEFAIIQRNIKSERSVMALCDRLIEAFKTPISVLGITAEIGISMGVAFCPQDASTVTELMKCADLALYRSKHEGRNRVCVFKPEMDIDAKERRTLENELKTAFKEGQFALYFQPLVDGQTSQVKAFEALLRWNHPTKGVITPDQFINMTEQTGMIVEIGEWVIRSALEEVATWNEDIRISINLSPIQVKHRGLLPMVTQALARSGINPKRLEFEVTESVLLEGSEETISALHNLRALGVQIALDDFGTGYSSLSYLRSFPFDRIKIDKSFVQAMEDSNECLAIVEAVAALATSLGMHATAEGVETKAQATKLALQGCDELQGFLFCRPKLPEELISLGLLNRKASPDTDDEDPEMRAIGGT